MSLWFDRADASGFLDLMYGQLDSGVVNLCKPSGDGLAVVHRAPLADVDWKINLLNKAAQTTNTVDLWVQFNPVQEGIQDPHRGTADQTAVLVALFADIDVAKKKTPVSTSDALAFLRTLPLRPTIIVASSDVPNGKPDDDRSSLHAYWVLTEPIILDTPEERLEAKSTFEGWGRAINAFAAKDGYAFDKVSEFNRVGRLPGSIYHDLKKRYDAERQVRTLDDGGNRYQLADFEQYIPEDDTQANLGAPEEGTDALSGEAIATICDAIVPFWTDGFRHPLALAVAGWLANSQIAIQSALELVRLCSDKAGDRNPAAKIKAVESSYAKLRAGTRPSGWLLLKDILDGDALGVLDRTLNPQPRRTWPAEIGSGNGNSTDELPALDAGEQHLPTITQQAWERVQRWNHPPTHFLFGDEPVRIETGDSGEPVTRPLTDDRLRHAVALATRWDKWSERDKCRKEAKPPKDVVTNMLASPDIPLPFLRGIVEAPVFGPNGELSLEPGYQPASRLFYLPQCGLEGLTVPAKPTDAELAEAIGLIKLELLGDFPFTGKAERAHAISYVLLPYCREMIHGPTPIHLFEKPAAGTGATLLISIGALIATGRFPAMMTEGRDEDEWRKRITATLRDSPMFVAVDNLRATLDSAALSSAVTSDTWKDRKLGASETIKIPVRCVWAASGNNPAMSSEISRRVIRIRMDAKIDKPWTREQFRHPKLTSWVTSERRQLVAACLTIIRSWIVAGCPLNPDTPSLGSFESWSQVMGSILHHAGISGFLENLDEFYAASDVEGAVIRGFLEAWWTAYGTRKVGVADLFQIAGNAGIDLGVGSERSQRIRLGRELHQLNDRYYTVEGVSICVKPAGTYQGTQRWQLLDRLQTPIHLSTMFKDKAS